MFALISRLKILFSSNPFGILFAILFSPPGMELMKDVFNPELHKKAIEFVIELNRMTNISNSEKARMFNDRMLKWLAAEGKKIGLSTLNFLRELAVNSVKIKERHPEYKVEGWIEG